MKVLRLLSGLLTLTILLSACASGTNNSQTPTQETPNKIVSTSSPVRSSPTATPSVDKTAVPAIATANDNTATPQSACDHPYLPLQQGATWTYKVQPANENLQWTVTSVTGDLTTATAHMSAVMQTPGGAVQIDYKWDCTAKDGIVSYDFATLNAMDTSQVHLTLKDLKGQGVILPPASELVPNAKWNLSINGGFSMQMAGGINANGTLKVDQTWHVLDTNPVTFEGRTLKGLSLSNDTSLNIQVNGSGSTTASLQNAYTLARGIGIVKQTIQTSLGNKKITETLQLISYKSP